MPSFTEPKLDFENIPKEFPREFVPQNANLRDVNQLESLYEQLIKSPIASSKDLENWLFKRSELEAALDEEGSIIYIRMTCQTDDPQRAKDYRDFIETIVPAIKPLTDQLNKKFIEELKKHPLDKPRYEVYVRALKTDIELFTQENVALQTQVDLLAQEYQTICGAMMVPFEGKDRTLPEMGKYLLEPDRDLRERAWRATAQRRLKDVDKLEDIFDKMLKLRAQVAKNAKCKDFCEYKFRSLHRFDYTPQDCKQYHKTVEEVVYPIWSQMTKDREKNMGLKRLRPWDTAVDPLGRAALKPFEKVDDLILKCEKIFNKVDPKLGEQFTEMMDLGLLDLASRKGKAPGGYQSALSESRKPFIFMNAVGVDDDMRTLLHEAGHAFHSLACSKEPLLDYRHGPMEFNEVASMSMELLGGEYINMFYGPENEKRSRQEHLEGVIQLLVWVANVDAFQHWIYENPTHTREERKKMWLAIRKRFWKNDIDWNGLEVEESYLWHRQLHIFEVPFYYIEYGIAQLGALQVWFNSKKNWSKAVSDYRQGLALGGSKPLPQLFERAGIRFDFSKNTIAPLMGAVQQELQKL